MLDRRVVKRDTDIGGWNCQWNLMQSWWPGHFDFFGFLEISLVYLEDRINYVVQSVALINSVNDVKGPMQLRACVLDLRDDKYYFISVADFWSRKLGFETRNQRRLARGVLESHNTNLITFPQRDLAIYNAYMSHLYDLYKNIRPFGHSVWSERFSDPVLRRTSWHQKW